MNWVVSFLQVPPKNTFTRSTGCQNLIATVLPHPHKHSQRSVNPPAKGVKINLHSSSSLIHKCQNYFPYIYHPLQVFSSSLLMKTSCLRLKLVELNFLVSFNTDDQSKTDVANAINIITYKSKSSRWTFSIKYRVVTPLFWLSHKMKPCYEGLKEIRVDVNEIWRKMLCFRVSIGLLPLILIISWYETLLWRFERNQSWCQWDMKENVVF